MKVDEAERIADAGDAGSARPLEEERGIAGPRVRRVLTALGVFTLVAAVAGGLLAFAVRDESAGFERREAAATVARRTAVALASLDHQNAQRGIDKALADMTGEARNQWATAAKELLGTLTKNELASTVQSVNAAVVSMDDDSAEVIVYVTSVTRSSKVPQGVRRATRWRFDLARADGRWRVSKLGIVP